MGNFISPPMLPETVQYGLGDRWRAAIDRLLSSDRFRRWAASFPLTRPIARRRTRALFDICAGFVYSQILFACVQLDLFDKLAEGPQTAPALALRLSLSVEGAERLLAAAVALKLAARRSGGRYGLGPLGAAMVGNDAATAMVRHHAILYGDLADPVALLRGEPAETELSRYWAYARTNQPAGLTGDDVADYTGLMAISQSMIAQEVLDAYPVARHRRLLDVGGGSGTFIRAAAGRAPKLSLMLFDLPQVAEEAKQRLDTPDLEGRLTVAGGDFLSGSLPKGADLISLIRVLHDHDDDRALILLKGIHEALPADGALLIAEPMSGTPGAEPIGDAYFGFYLLAMRSGRPRTPAEIGTMLTAAGFRSWRLIPSSTPLLARLIMARP
jgi:demethylspheroidene O-methyltransferase